MEQKLHEYGKVIFTLAKNTDGLRLASEADCIKYYSTTAIIGIGLSISILGLLTLSMFQYNTPTRFTK
ncbi:unnamed protein product [Phytomonas sp. Hart1]|nr:unnamed protein product [Phytomonas sp. Hart1]|eukprot:CCW69632.1 unnamed protein product [Phytomonas sp. isolate Hart1]